MTQRLVDDLHALWCLGWSRRRHRVGWRRRRWDGWQWWLARRRRAVWRQRRRRGWRWWRIWRRLGWREGWRGWRAGHRRTWRRVVDWHLLDSGAYDRHGPTRIGVGAEWAGRDPLVEQRDDVPRGRVPTRDYLKPIRTLYWRLKERRGTRTNLRVDGRRKWAASVDRIGVGRRFRVDILLYDREVEISLSEGGRRRRPWWRRRGKRWWRRLR